jgi:hypothetical protein
MLRRRRYLSLDARGGRGREKKRREERRKRGGVELAQGKGKKRGGPGVFCDIHG